MRSTVVRSSSRGLKSLHARGALPSAAAHQQHRSRVAVPAGEDTSALASILWAGSSERPFSSEDRVEKLDAEWLRRALSGLGEARGRRTSGVEDNGD